METFDAATRMASTIFTTAEESVEGIGKNIKVTGEILETNLETVHYISKAGNIAARAYFEECLAEANAEATLREEPSYPLLVALGVYYSKLDAIELKRIPDTLKQRQTKPLLKLIKGIGAKLDALDAV